MVPGSMLLKVMVLWPIKSWPIGSWSQTRKRIRAISGMCRVKTSVSSHMGLKPEKQRDTDRVIHYKFMKKEYTNERFRILVILAWPSRCSDWITLLLINSCPLCWCIWFLLHLSYQLQRNLFLRIWGATGLYPRANIVPHFVFIVLMMLYIL